LSQTKAKTTYFFFFDLGSIHPKRALSTAPTPPQLLASCKWSQLINTINQAIRETDEDDEVDVSTEEKSALPLGRNRPKREV
jgi:hypothetical protein